MKSFNVKKAKSFGYSDEEINSFMAKKDLVPKMSVSGFVGNVAKSGVGVVKDLAHSVLHPVETVKALGNLGVGVAQKFTPGVQEKEKYANAVGNFYKDKYGGVDNVLRTAYTDPVGTALDVSMVTGAGAGLLKTGANLASKGARAVDLASTTARVGRAGTRLSRFSEAVDPLRAVGNVSRGAVNKVKATRPAEFVTSTAKNLTPGKFLTRGLGGTAEQGKMIVPMEELIPKYNMYGRTEAEAQSAISKLGKERTLAVESSGAYGKLQDLIKPLDDEIQAMRSNPNMFRGDMPLSSEASKRMSQLVENRNNIVRRFAQTEDNVTNLNPQVSVADIDAFRREAIDPNIPEGSFARQMSQRPARDKAFQQTRKALKGAVDEKAGTQQIGKDMQSLYKAKKVFKGYNKRVANRQQINVHKMGGALLGGKLGGVPGAIGGYLAEQIINSPKGAEMIYKTLKSAQKSIGFTRKLGKNKVVSSLTKQLNKMGTQNAEMVAKQIYNYLKAGRVVQ